MIARDALAKGPVETDRRTAGDPCPNHHPVSLARLHLRLAIALGLLVGAPTALSARQAAVTPTDADWIVLFDGTSLNGWIPKIRTFAVGENFANTFRAEDGLLKVRYDGYKDSFQERFGHLFYEAPFSYYRLSMDYRFSGHWLSDTPAWAWLNSGVMVHSQDPATMMVEQDFPISVEVQFLGELEPGSERPTANMCSPGTHIVLNGELDQRHCINSTSPTIPRDRWVHIEVEVLGNGTIRHFVDGEMVIEYSGSQVGGGVVNGFDPAVKVDGTPLSGGWISLQAEGQELDFRNVRLLNLQGCMDRTSLAFRSWYVADDPAACRE